MRQVSNACISVSRLSVCLSVCLSDRLQTNHLSLSQISMTVIRTPVKMVQLARTYWTALSASVHPASPDKNVT